MLNIFKLKTDFISKKQLPIEKVIPISLNMMQQLV